MADDDQTCKDHDRLHAAIDLGSGVAKIASHHVLAGEKAYNVAIDDVHIVSLLRPDVQQIVVIDDNCQTMLGDDGKPLIGTGAVAQWAFQHPEESGRILELFKLALCHESKQSVAVQRVYDILEVKGGDFGALQIVIRSILACFKRAVIHRYQTYSARNLHGQYTATYWEALPIELQITVPCMWKAQERGVMRDSLVEARFTNVRFRSEPTCAAARIMSILFDRKDIAMNDCVVFVDIGSGTVDVATIRIELSSTPLDKPRLVKVGRTHACPELEKKGGPQEVDRRLRISAGEFLRQLSDEVGQRKPQFPGKGRYSMTIYGSHKTAEQACSDSLDGLLITIPEDQMKAAFQLWLDEEGRVIVEHLEETQSLKRQGAVLTGGGAQSQYNYDFLQTKLETFDIPTYQSNKKYPVARGALQLCLENEPDELPDEIYFYISRSESWARELAREAHEDVTHWEREKDKVIALPRMSEVEPDKWDPSVSNVPHRLYPTFELRAGKEPDLV